MLAVGRAHAVAARGASPDAVVPHHPLDPAAADGLALGTARRAVSFPMVSMNALDIAQQPTIGDLARALRPCPPSVVARWRHAQRCAHDGHRPDASLILDQ